MRRRHGPHSLLHDDSHSRGIGGSSRSTNMRRRPRIGPLRSLSLFALASLAYEHAVTAALKRLSPRFFAVSAASADWLHRFNIDDAEVVPNGVEPLREAPSRTPGAFAKPVVFFAGRLIPEKGVRQLVAAVERLVRQGADVQLRIAGQGPLSRFLTERASEAPFLQYLGQLSPEQIAAEMASATVFVNPSDYPEGLPTTLLEAGAAALPVISTPRGGSVDLIRNGTTGWLIPDNAPESIVASLSEALAQPDGDSPRHRALFARPRQVHLALHSQEVSRLCRLYESLRRSPSDTHRDNR